ncbi:MAG TPA: sensor histidine kinase, partial [Microcoleaceae cyanobacterium]
DWKSTLKQTAEQVCQRLKAERFLVLLYDKDRDEFAICYQSHPGNRRPLPGALETLSESDWRLLEQSQSAITIENLDGDLKFMSWRDRLLEVGARAMIVCNTAIGRQPIEGLVMVCYETPRTWSRPEQDLLRVVSQQIGVILHEWQLQKHSDQQHRINEAIQRGLLVMQQSHEVEAVERSALQHISQVLQVPLAALVVWLPGHNAGRIIVPTSLNERFGLNLNMVIPNQTDLLIQWTLEHRGILAVTIADLTPETRQWINGSNIGQVLTLALRTSPEHQPTGMILVADVAERHWSEYHLAAMLTLGSQLAWSRRYLALTDRLTTQCEGLEQLNWYKQRVVEDSYRSIVANVKRLNDLGNPKDPLFVTRQQQLLRQLQDTLMPLAQLVRDEQWQLRSYSTTISLISLLKRALERVDSFLKQRQIWSQVHDETNVTIGGDIIKIELILYEVLVSACQRAVTGGRIDIWCRQIDTRWFELSITDNGLIEPNLLLALEADHVSDQLAPSILDHPPGLHLAICRSLMKQIGGEFTLTRLDDGRIFSRLVLPISASQTPSKAKPLGQSQ